MTIFESIKNYFAPAYDKRLVNPVKDAELLSALGRESVFITASDSKEYYYYFPIDSKDVNIAKYLLRRNGVPVRVHVSTYHYHPHKALRAPSKLVTGNAAAQKFVDSIDVENSKMLVDEVNTQRAIILRQMSGHVK